MFRAISVMTELDNRQQEVAMGTTPLHPIIVLKAWLLHVYTVSEQSFNIYQRDSEHYYIIKVLLIQDTTFNF